MEMQHTFKSKWKKITGGRLKGDEESLFVDIGKIPQTQRQLNLYYYFLFIKDVFKNLNVSEVLEIGCGRGTESLYLARYLDKHLSLIDDSEDAIKIAREQFSGHNLKANFTVGDAINTNFKDGSFDAIISIGLAEHFQKRDVAKLFQEEFRLLRPGGVMISLNIPKKLWSIQSLNIIVRLFKKITKQYKQPLNKDYFRNGLKPREYKQIAQLIGFENIKITHVCPFPIYVPISEKVDKTITAIRRFILAVRNLFQTYPYKTNPAFSLAHFLVAYKPKEGN